jgi:hypothetical protein
LSDFGQLLGVHRAQILLSKGAKENVALYRSVPRLPLDLVYETRASYFDVFSGAW